MLFMQLDQCAAQRESGEEEGVRPSSLNYSLVLHVIRYIFLVGPKGINQSASTTRTHTHSFFLSFFKVWDYYIQCTSTCQKALCVFVFSCSRARADSSCPNRFNSLTTESVCQIFLDIPNTFASPNY